MKMNLKTFVGGTVLAMAMAAAAASAQEVVLKDDFSYAGNEALRSAWTNVTGSQMTLVTSDDEVDHEPYVTLGNGIARRDLPTGIKEQDWSVSFRILHTANARGGWVGLFNADGTRGYALMWDSGNNPHPANGTILISKFDLEAEPASWSEYGTPLKIGPSDRTDAGHPIHGPAFAEMKLAWDAQTGTLTASVNGKETLLRTDGDFKEFSRLYVRGNTVVKYDDIVVTVGEAAAP